MHVSFFHVPTSIVLTHLFLRVILLLTFGVSFRVGDEATLVLASLRPCAQFRTLKVIEIIEFESACEMIMVLRVNKAYIVIRVVSM